jgi:hypothetical protein
VGKSKIVDVEALKRLVVRLLALAELSADLPLERDLRKLANEFVDLIEGCGQPGQPDQPERAMQQPY